MEMSKKGLELPLILHIQTHSKYNPTSCTIYQPFGEINFLKNYALNHYHDVVTCG